MATVADLLTHVQNVASLNTGDATETALATAWLNEGYQRAVARAGLATRTTTVTPAAAATSLTAASYAPAASVSAGSTAIKGIYKNQGTSGANGVKLERVSMDELQSMRTAIDSSSIGPTVYSVRPNGIVEFYPAATGTDVLTIDMSMLPLLLNTSAGSGYETTPTAFPAQFHYDVIASHAISRAFEYRGNETRAQYFRVQSENGLRELVEWANEMGGVNGPRVKVFRGRRNHGYMPDQRW